MTAVTEPFVYTDSDGDRLEISDGPGRSANITTAGDAVWVRAEHLPRIVAAMYEKAGLPAPIVEGAPPMGGLEPQRFADGSSVYWDADSGMVTQRGRNGHGCLQWSPQEAIDVGVWLIAFGRAAEAEPHPDAVERLAAFLAASMDTTPLDLARTLLRRFHLEERGLMTGTNDKEPTP